MQDIYPTLGVSWQCLTPCTFWQQDGEQSYPNNTKTMCQVMYFLTTGHLLCALNMFAKQWYHPWNQHNGTQQFRVQERPVWTWLCTINELRRVEQALKPLTTMHSTDSVYSYQNSKTPASRQKRFDDRRKQSFDNFVAYDLPFLQICWFWKLVSEVLIERSRYLFGSSTHFKFLFPLCYVCDEFFLLNWIETGTFGHVPPIHNHMVIEY